MNSLNRLTAAVIDQLETREEWSLSRDEILEILKLDIRDVYGLIVGSDDPLVSFRITEYTSREPGVLVSFLECLGFSEAAVEFWKAGIWIPYEIQIELQEVLIEQVVAARNKHRPDFDTFLGMFDHFNELIRALHVYIEEFFSQTDLIENAIQNVLYSHQETNLIPAALLLRSLAGELFKREIVPFWNLLSPIFPQLKAYLIKMNRIAEPEEERRQQGRPGSGGNVRTSVPDESHARSLFRYGISERIDGKDLKKRYRERMKEYHPDVNPEGLELSKEINLAYALLLSVN